MFKVILSVIVAAIAYFVSAYVLRIPIVISAGIGLALYLAAPLVLGRDRERFEDLPDVDGMSRQAVRDVILGGQEKVARMREMRDTMTNERIADKVEAICGVADKIFAEFETDPKDIKIAQRFLEYYLDATLLVVQRYADLSNRGGDRAQVHKVLDGFEELLNTIHHTFEKQLDMLLRDEVLDLDTEMTVLKQMMQMEGL